MLLERFARPPRDAAVVLSGLQPSVRPSRDGTAADLGGVLAGVRSSIGDPAAAVRVEFVPAAPAISNVRRGALRTRRG